MVGTTRNNIHATVGSITWNPHHRWVEYPSSFHLLSTTSGECKRRAMCLSKDLNEIFGHHHSRCVWPPSLGLDKSVSEPCLIVKQRLCTGTRDLHAPLGKRHLSVQTQRIFWKFSPTTFQSLGSYFFSVKNWTVFSLAVSCFWMFRKKTHVTWEETTESTSHTYWANGPTG